MPTDGAIGSIPFRLYIFKQKKSKLAGYHIHLVIMTAKIISFTFKMIRLQKKNVVLYGTSRFYMKKQKQIPSFHCSNYFILRVLCQHTQHQQLKTEFNQPVLKWKQHTVLLADFQKQHTQVSFEGNVNAFVISWIFLSPFLF